MVEVEEAITVEMFTDVLQTRIEQGAREEAVDPPPLQEDPKPPYVQLMTIHAAKGLKIVSGNYSRSAGRPCAG